MKSLSLSKPLIMITMGYPGAGKSFFARQFADMFGAPLVSYDRLRYELFTEPSYSPDEHAVVQQIGQYMVNELAKTSRTLIVDGGGSSRAERQSLIMLARKQGYSTLVVWVQTDLTTCGMRAIKRNPNKLDDKFNTSLTDEQFNAQVKRLAKPSVYEDTVVISGKHTFSTQARTVLKKITTPRSASPTAPVADTGQVKNTEPATAPAAPARERDLSRQAPPRRPDAPRRRSLTIN